MPGPATLHLIHCIPPSSVCLNASCLSSLIQMPPEKPHLILHAMPGVVSSLPIPPWSGIGFS